MQTKAFQWTSAGFSPPLDNALGAQLVLAFGTRAVVPEVALELRRTFPGAIVVAGSSSGEIHGDLVSEGTVTVTAVAFARTRLSLQVARCGAVDGSEARARSSADRSQRQT